MICTDELSTPCAWISLGVFLACILCVIMTPKIPILPRRRFCRKFLSCLLCKRKSKQNHVALTSSDNVNVHSEITASGTESHFYWITLSMATVPIISLALLFILRCLSWDTFLIGIIGDEKIRPYGVIILFMSLSYICISLDITGLFEYIAKVIIRKSAGRGHALFIFFGLFASILTLFTSNDIVILTLTPICCYLARNADNLDLIPFVVSQFFLANVWSVAFQIGNPTNMIVAEAYKMNFLGYLLVMGLPAATAGIINFVLLYVIFYDRIPKQIITSPSKREKQELSPELKKKCEAMIKAIGLLLTLVLLTVASLRPLSDGKTIPSYLICLAFGGLFFIIDLIMDVIHILHNSQHFSMHRFYHDKRTILVAIRMPWKIVPFVFGMFVMVELLDSYGFVTLIASFLTDTINFLSSTTSGTSFTSILAACFVISILSTLTSNVLNNQPMTILFTKILLNPAFIQNITLQKASSLSLILGSNLGANVTLIGALAGVMWVKILQDNGITHQQMNYWKFLKYGCAVTPLALTGATIIIAIEMLLEGASHN